MRTRALAILLALLPIGAAGQVPAATQGVTYISPGGIRLRLMLDDSNIGRDVSVGEMTFPASIDSGDHRHGATEIFYVVSGTLEHVVNGQSVMLTAGMTGFVKPPDTVRHKTGPDGAKTVVMWVPGDEAQKIVARWKREEAGTSQTATSPTLKEANALLAASKNEEAATAFQSLIRADDTDVSAWLGFGQAQENLGQSDKALTAYSRVIELSPSPVFQTRMAIVSIAGVYAAKGDRAKAYEWLNKLADSHPAPAFLGIITGAKAFASLKDEPRFKQVLEQLKPCNSPEYHQFDFWIGSWEVQSPQQQPVGHNDISRIVGGCILQENWVSSRVVQSGTSFNFYDYRDRKWHQDYYDNSGNMGNYPPLTGEFREGKMILVSALGVQPLSRWTWYELAPGKVRQMAEQSTDAGKTWSVTWDSIYVKK